MYRIQGIINAVAKAAALTTGRREIGQLAHLTNAGEVSFTTDDLYFPLTEAFDVTNGDTIASMQMTGIANVYVETSASIVAGSPVNAGTTGLGVKLAVAGETIMGYALKTPAGDTDMIPVLLQKSAFPEPAA